MGYVVGVYDTHHNLFNLPPSDTINQICNVVGKYLDEHPEELNEPAVKLVLRGLLGMPFQKVPIKKN